MAYKCNITSIKSRKDIEKEIVKAIELSTASERVSAIKEAIQEIVNHYEVQDSQASLTDTVVNTIWPVITDYGLDRKHPLFFNSENLKNFVGTRKVGEKYINTDTTTQMIDSKDTLNRREVNLDFINGSYGKAESARDYAVIDVKKHLADALFLGRGLISGHKGTVLTTSQLNKNVKLYQQLLLDEIIDYLLLDESLSEKEIKFLKSKPKMYNKLSGVLIKKNGLDAVMEIADRYLKPNESISDDMLITLHQDKDINTSSKRKLRAYNARIFLNNFDNFITLTFGDDITINDLGRKTGKKNKYMIADKQSHSPQSFRTTDPDVNAETSKITKLLIELIPVLKYGKPDLIGETYLTFQEFSSLIGKLKTLLLVPSVHELKFDETFRNYKGMGKSIIGTKQIWDNLSWETLDFLKDKTLARAIAEMKIEDEQALASVLELFMNKDFYDKYQSSFLKKSEFSPNEMNLLWSIYKGIYDRNEDSGSIYASSKSIQRINYYDNINLVANSIFSTSFLLLYQDSDDTKIRFLTDTDLFNVKRQIENKINSKVFDFTEKSRERYTEEIANKYNIDFDNGDVTFLIPLDNGLILNGKVTLSTLDILFTLNDKLLEILDYNKLFADPKFLKFTDEFTGLNLYNDRNLLSLILVYDELQSGFYKDLLDFTGRIIANQYASVKLIKRDPNGSTTQSNVKSVFGEESSYFRYNPGSKQIPVVSLKDNIFLRAVSKAVLTNEGKNTAIQTKDSEGNAQSLQTFTRLVGAINSLWEIVEKEQPHYIRGTTTHIENDFGRKEFMGSASRDFSLLNKIGLFKGLFGFHEFYNRPGATAKKATDFTAAELIHLNLINMFAASLVEEDEKTANKNLFDTIRKGNAAFQASVNSDKNLLGFMNCDLNTPMPIYDSNGNRVIENGILKEKNYIDFTPEEHKNLIKKEIGDFYANAYERIENDYLALSKYIVDRIIPILKQLYTNPLIHIALDGFLELNYGNNFLEYKEWYVLNPILHEIFPRESSLVRYAVKQYNKEFPFNPIELIDLVHITKENLKRSNGLISQLNTFNPKFLEQKGIILEEFDEKGERLYYDSDQYWAALAAETLRTIVNSNFDLSFFKYKKNPFIKNLKTDTLDLIKRHLQQEKYETHGKNTWVKYDKLVMAYVHLDYKTLDKDGNVVDIKKDIPITDLTSLYQFGKFEIPKFNEVLNDIEKFGWIELNPIMEKHMYMGYLLTQEWQNAGVGSFIGLADKSGSNNQLKQEGSMFTGQMKRNVGWTAQVNQILTDKLNGPAANVKMSTIKDLTGYGTVLSAKDAEINVYGGMTLVSPFMCYLENGGLKGSAVGMIKKNFCYFKHPETGIGGIIKTANFPFTNDSMRKFPGHLNLMWKMTSIDWTDEFGKSLVGRNIIDITKDFFGNDITYGEHPEDSDKNGVFFKTKDKKIYKLSRFEKTGPNTYKRYVREVLDKTDPTKLGQEITMDLDNNITAEPIVITNNYDLWKAFGGRWSMEITDSQIFDRGEETKFIPSENSIKQVVHAMNNIGYFKSLYKDNPKVRNSRTLSQKHVFQPLKHSDILWVMALDSIKIGPANINPESSWSDRESLDFQRVPIFYLMGPQLDKEHSAENAHVTLMTLVVSSVSQTLHTSPQALNVYNALKTITDVGLKTMFNSLDKYIIDKKAVDLRDFSNTVMDILIKSLAKPDSDQFAELLAYKIKQSLEEGTSRYRNVDWALSDNAIFNKAISTFASYISKLAINIKVQGTLSVLNPAEGFVKLYDGKSFDLFEDPNKELNELQKKYDLKPVFDSNSSPYDVSKMEFGRTYKVIYNDSVIDHPDRIWTPGKKTFRNLAIEYNDNITSPFSIDGNKVTINPKLVELEFNLKPWKSQGTPYDFKTVNEWIAFLLTMASIKSDIRLHQAEDDLNYQKRLSFAALSHLTGVNYEAPYMLNLDKLLQYLRKEHQQRVDETTLEYNERIQHEFDEENIRILDASTRGRMEYIKLTPDKYYELRQLALQGKIKKITEYVKVGRDLDPYNIRFSGIASDNSVRNFNLWDLDSVKIKHQVVQMMKENNPEVESNLIEWFVTTTGNEATSFADVYNYYTRLVLRDIENLSHLTMNKNVEFDNILQEADPEIREKKIDSFILYRLSERDKNYYNLHKNDAGFDKISFIRNSDTLKNIIYIDDIPIQIDVNSVTIQPYELVMPKLWTKEFGFNLNTPLEEVLNDPDWFTKRFLRNKQLKETTNYDVVLENMDGKHVYILNKKNLPSNLEKLDIRVTKDNTDGKWYREDSNGNTVLEVPEGTTFYTDGNVEIMVLPDTQKKSFIKNLKQCLGLFGYSSINFGDNILNGNPNELFNLITELAQVDDYLKWQYLKALLATDKMFENTDEDIDDFVYNSAAVYEFKQLLNKYKTINDLPASHYFRKLGAKKYTAFKKSLDIVAARIPAQSMLSFMAMKVVMYENPNINNAYVNSLQLFLQGSDLDIDSVTLCTYNINKSGLLDLHSPYANNTSTELLTESLHMPLPTNESIWIEVKDSEGNTLKVINTEKKTVDEFEEFLNKYEKIFKFTFEYDENNNVIGISKIRLDNSSTENIRLINDLVQLTAIPTFDSASDGVKFRNHISSILNIPNIENLVLLFLNVLADAIDAHNMYFLNNKSNYNKLFRIMNNYMHSNMYDAIIDPANQQAALESVDGYTTNMIKDVTKTHKKAIEIANNSSKRGPGNTLGMTEAVRATLEGKDCIARSASALKGFFAAYYSSSKILNSTGDRKLAELLYNALPRREQKNTSVEEIMQNLIKLAQGRLLKRKRKGNFQFLLSNLMARDISTIQNEEVLDVILSMDTDPYRNFEQDAVLLLSSLLGLSADNAKELVLSKINAGVNIIGLYLYGIASGIKFETLKNVIMGNTGRTLLRVFEGNIFNKNLPKYHSLAEATDYLTKEGFKKVYEKLPEGEKWYKYFIKHIPKEYKNFWKKVEALKEEGDKRVYLSDLIKVINDQRYSKDEKDKPIPQAYRTFLDTVLKYLMDYDESSPDTMLLLRHLAYGAAEFLRLGSFILNKEVKGSLEDLLKINLNLEYLILDSIKEFKKYRNNILSKDELAMITEDLDIIIETNRLFVDPVYLEEMILKVNRYSHSVNILETITTAEHLRNYLKTCATIDAAFKLMSYRYRSIRGMFRKVKRELPGFKQDLLVSKLSALAQYAMLTDWLSMTRKSFILPPGNTYFDPNSNIESKPIKYPRKIYLGTDAGNNTFRLWMEREVIPNLKLGKNIAGKNGTVNGIDVANNEFIQKLAIDSKNNQGLGNVTLLYTLANINMIPKAGSIDEKNLKRLTEAYELLSGYNYTEGQEDLTNPFLNLHNLFTLYTMIAFEWKPGLNSLFKIINNNSELSGYRQEYFNYVQAMDNDPEASMADSTDLMDQIPRLFALRDDPYTSELPYIILTDDDYGYVLGERIENNSEESEDFDGEEDPLRVGNYRKIYSDADTRFFFHGESRKNRKKLKENKKIKVVKEGVEQDLSGELDVSYNNREYESVNFNGKDYNIRKLGFKDGLPTKVLLRKLGKFVRVPKVNTDKIIDAIENIENPKNNC